MLIHFGVVPYLVFDGDFLPGKAGTEAERATRREESRRKGLEYYRMNKPSQAHLELQKAVDVTPSMARELIEELRHVGVEYLVAPYEADAQLVYLEKKGIIEGILSEDSDLLVFGAKRLLTKLDQYGDCIEINRADFSACREISLVGWTDEEFRRMAILSGCDYLGNITGMGLKNAYRLVRKFKTAEKVVRMLQFDGKYHVPPGYLEDFQRAELTFRFQRVYCPQQKKVVPIGDINLAGIQSDLLCIGAEVEHSIAAGVARGDLDPMTKKPITLPLSSKSLPRTPLVARQSSWKETGLSQVKGNQSIETFLKTQRTPLAELDPNQFTPSPTQEQLLRQSRGALWQSNGTPSIASNQGTRVALVQARSPFSEIRASSKDLSKTTIFTPGKKRKIIQDCKDGAQRVVEEAGPPAEVHSHFFQSPHTSLGRKSRKSKGTKINIWSDGSEVTAGTSQAEKPTPSLLEMEDQSSHPEHHPVKTDVVSEVAGTERTSEGDATCIVAGAMEVQAPTSLKRLFSAENSGKSNDSGLDISPSDTVQKLDHCVKRELAAVTRINSFQYKPEASRHPPSEEGCKTQPAMSQMPKSSLQPNRKPPISRMKSMTPLQRLGLGAMCHPLSSDGSKVPKDSQDIQLSADFPPVFSAQKKCLADPEEGCNIKASSASTCLQGSEDALCPESEDVCHAVLGKITDQGNSIDLAQFSFNG